MQPRFSFIFFIIIIIFLCIYLFIIYVFLKIYSGLRVAVFICSWRLTVFKA